MSVLIETSFGDITVDLWTQKCPNATLNFLKLCKMKHFNNALFAEVQKSTIQS
jgi:peptidyl-prolyl cis-trans isomerase-like 4